MQDTERLSAGASPPPPQSFSFSTDSLPVQERADYFQDVVAPLLSVHVEAIDDTPPRHAMSFSQAGPVGIGIMACSPTLFRRGRSHHDGSDDFFFNPMISGWQVLTVDGAAMRLDAGEGCLLHVSNQGDCLLPEGGSAFGIRIGADTLRRLVDHPEDRIGRPVRREHPGMALLSGYVRSFAEAGATLTPELRQSFGSHVVDLVAGIIGATRDGAEQATGGGIRAARLRQILDSIRRRACDRQFGVEVMAAEIGVTARAVQLILEETGSTFSEHICEHRLGQARRLLTSSRSRLSIAEVAYEAGFNDLSHFYRSFRRRYGETPAAVRATGGAIH
jgi:AraC-like DNA-binding protein